MTSAQLEPSAHAPCTSTTFFAATGAAVCARASIPPNVPASTPIANAVTNRTIFIVQLRDWIFCVMRTRHADISVQCPATLRGTRRCEFSPSFRGARSASYDVQLHIRESILIIVVMDSGPAPRGASPMCNCTSENDDGRNRRAQKTPRFPGAFSRSANIGRNQNRLSGGDLGGRTVDHLRRLAARADRNAAGLLGLGNLAD